LYLPLQLDTLAGEDFRAILREPSNAEGAEEDPEDDDDEEEKAPKKVEYIFDAPPLSSRDKAKIERNRRKEDRQREVRC
jgi:hypothetical protein